MTGPTAQSPAAAIDAAIRECLGEGATMGDAAAIVGENANAWRMYVRSVREPTTGKVDAWLIYADVGGWSLRLTWDRDGAQCRATRKA